MKIMYLITTMGHGRGGHFYSLKTTAESLSNEIEAHIVNIGINNSPVIDRTNVPHTNIIYTGWNIFSAINQLKKIIKQFNPTVIHSFDYQAHSFARILSYISQIPLVHTKCGGPNPSGYYPFVKNFILYSSENLEYFKSLSKYRDTDFYLIPNRVNKVQSDEQRVALIHQQIDLGKKTFLRIARFGPTYLNSIKQSINLVEMLNHQGHYSQLIIIGTIEDKGIYNKIISMSENKNFIYIFTDDKFTINASELIDVADIVIGTGRSLMEATSMNKIVMTPVQGEKYPILVDNNNFQELLSTNFSPRNFLPKEDMENGMLNLFQILDNNKDFVEAKSFSKYIFEEYFNIQTKKSLYLSLYRGANPNKEKKLLDTIENMLRTLRNFLKESK
jgi:hypothetical protein